MRLISFLFMAGIKMPQRKKKPSSTKRSKTNDFCWWQHSSSVGRRKNETAMFSFSFFLFLFCFAPFAPSHME